MRKSTTIIIVVIVLIVLVGGGFALFHNSSNPSSTSTPSKSSNGSNATPVNNAVLVTKTDETVGQYLADPASGKALYTFGGDTNGVSNCTGSCLAVWPAYVDTGATTGLPSGVSTIKRTDNGQMQFTYNGKPLYFFASDSAGQVTGNGVQNFSIAKPAASSSSSAPATSNNSSSGPSY